MQFEITESEQIQSLQDEIDRLKIVNEALMNRVEHSTDAAGSSYSLFEYNLLLQNKVQEHTGKLVEINRALKREIRERKKTEKALRESEERFRGIVENASDIIYVLTNEGIISYISPIWTKILGYEISEALGESFEPLIHPDDLPKCRAFLNKVIETGEKQSGIEYRIKHKSGGWRWHTSSASVVKDDDGNVFYFIGIARDVTESKRMLEELQNAYRDLRDTQTQLVQSQKMAALGRLVAGVAHEFNNPIGAMRSATATLNGAVKKLNQIHAQASTERQSQIASQDTKPLAALQNCLTVIEEGTNRVANIVSRLRAFACLDEAEIQRVNINENLLDTISILKSDLKTGVSIQTQLSEIPVITCYPAKLNQLFLQLFLNGSQAIEQNGTITVSTRLSDHGVQIAVSDSGRGIPKQNLDKIFDPGFTTWSVGVGVGLGLSICYQVVQEHFGNLEVESEVGKGSTFTVTLPIDLEKHLSTMRSRKSNSQDFKEIAV